MICLYERPMLSIEHLIEKMLIGKHRTGTIALGVVYDSSNSQVALGDANVYVGALLL